MPPDRSASGKLLLPAVILMLFAQAVPAEITIDTFTGLQGWKELSFRNIESGSEYESARGGELLRVRSRGGASMLVLEEEIDVYETPLIRWRWRVTEEIAGQDLRSREGDDAAIRLYVAFRKPLSQRSFGERIWAAVQENVYGEIPPDSAISFVWSSRSYRESAFLSSYTERQYLVIPEILGEGSFLEGTWVEHEVHLLKIYRRLFGEEPPGEAFVAIMGDSDNTGGSSEAWLDYLSFSAP
jgi:hypothetical protein